jgi:hypothetical protein
MGDNATGYECSWHTRDPRPCRLLGQLTEVLRKFRRPMAAVGPCPDCQELEASGCEPLRAIAAGLEERGLPAARGGKWSAVQVARLWEVADSSPFEASRAVA